MNNVMTFANRTPLHTLPIALNYVAVDTKAHRDQHCIECGHKFLTISDKFVSVDDGGIPIDQLRDSEKVIEAHCKNHYCKQYYRIFA